LNLFKAACKASTANPVDNLIFHLRGRPLAWLLDLPDAQKKKWHKMEPLFLKAFEPSDRLIQQRVAQSYIKRAGETVEEFAARMTSANTFLRATNSQKSTKELANLFITAMRMEGHQYRITFIGFKDSFEQALERAKEVERDIINYAEDEEHTSRRNNSRKPALTPSPATPMRSTVQAISTIRESYDSNLALRIEALEQKAQHIGTIQATPQQSQTHQLSYTAPPKGQQETQMFSGNAKKADCFYCERPGHYEKDCRTKKWDQSQNVLGKQAVPKWMESWARRHLFWKEKARKENNPKKDEEPQSDLLKQYLAQYLQKNQQGGDLQTTKAT
jgi:hypothetical protein